MQPYFTRKWLTILKTQMTFNILHFSLFNFFIAILFKVLVAVHSSTIILVCVSSTLYCSCCVLSPSVVMRDFICKLCVILTLFLLGCGVDYAKIDNLLQWRNVKVYSE
jgi:hypothetical protein